MNAMTRESGVVMGILGYNDGTRPVRSTPNLAPNVRPCMSKEAAECILV